MNTCPSSLAWTRREFSKLRELEEEEHLCNHTQHFNTVYVLCFIYYCNISICNLLHFMLHLDWTMFLIPALKVGLLHAIEIGEAWERG